MSLDESWDIDSYREEHESEDHWQLRKVFMEKWKNDYPEDRLVCLARVFANIELLGCRYPIATMQEVSRLSYEVAQEYRKSRKGKLKRTFVSASDAAEDRARGVKREGGIVLDAPSPKSRKIAFIPQGQQENNNETEHIDQPKTTNNQDSISSENNSEAKTEKTFTSEVGDTNDYLKEMLSLNCLDVRSFSEQMFFTPFGRMVLLIRPWTSMLSNIQASCQACRLQATNTYVNGMYSLHINGELVSEASGATKAEARSIVEIMAWNRLRTSMVSVLVKKQWIAHGATRVSVGEIAARENEFGAPVENSVATKMMQMMGWKGGGLGAEAQGIAEPIKPHLQMVNRAGLGSQSSDIRQLRRSAQALISRYLAADTLDVDLVFSSEFSKDERAALHQCAQRAGLASRSYGDTDRFLVVKKKLDPFSLVSAVIEKGGNTPKYQVFIPATLASNG